MGSSKSNSEESDEFSGDEAFVGVPNSNARRNIFIAVSVLATIVGVVGSVVGTSAIRRNRLRDGVAEQSAIQVIPTAGPTSSPSVFPSVSPAPSNRPSAASSFSPSSKPTEFPSTNPSNPMPTEFPTMNPSDPFPTKFPTMNPSNQPISPTRFPTLRPSGQPINPTQLPTLKPTEHIVPTRSPTNRPSDTRRTETPTKNKSDPTETVFFAIGDVPYTDSEASRLRRQMLEQIPRAGHFLVHVGDIRKAQDRPVCRRGDFESVREILKLSPIPVLLLHGDNEYNDCSNFNDAKRFWHDAFDDLLDNWDHSLNIVRQPGRTENFAFRRGSVLFVGLNLVGGRVHDQSEWNDRLSSQWNWFRDQVEAHRSRYGGRIVLMGHAVPGQQHARFFTPLKNYFSDPNAPPLLYVHGDKHVWGVFTGEYGRNSRRIQLTAGASEGPLRIQVSGGSLKYFRN